MKRLFRHTSVGISDYAALALFATFYLAALALVLAPVAFVGS